MVATIYVGANRLMGPVPVASNLLFQSGFESASAISAMNSCGGEACWKDFSGTDASTGATWPYPLWGGTLRSLQISGLNGVNATSILTYMNMTIATVTGHGGGNSQVMHQQMFTPGGPNFQSTGLYFNPGATQGDLYVSFWLKFNSDFAAKIGTNSWRSFFAWKTAGDYRVEAYVYRNPGTNGGNPYWYIQGDNNANNDPALVYHQFWEDSNTVIPCTSNWFKFEIAWHRSTTNGWIWSAIDGTTWVNRSTSLINTEGTGNNWGLSTPLLTMNRLFFPLMYSGGSFPIEQWCDDIVIRDGRP